MKRNELFNILDGAFSGERAKDLATKITQFARSPGSTGYLKATDLVALEMRTIGFDSVETVDFAVKDAWEVSEASLDVVCPEHIHLVDLEMAPNCVMSWSDSTAPDAEVLPVIDVGTGETPEHFTGKPVSGNVVFIRGTTRRPGFWEASRLALEHGARGIITDYMLYQTPGIRTPELAPENTQLLRLQVRNKPIWGFSISHSASLKLQALLEKSPVKVRAKALCRTYPSVGRNVVATIEGRDLAAEELLFCAHSSGTKPGGNCAAGVGLTVELGRTIVDLIRQGKIERPRRSLRFLIVIEGSGTAKYLDDSRHRLDDILATFTYCSSGNDQKKTLSALCMFRSPDSVPSYINDYLAELMEESPKDAYWIEKDGGLELSLVSFVESFYTPWSDNSTFSAQGLPAPLFMSWPDRYFHSQFLTADIIDPAVIRRAALVSLVAAVELGSAGAREAAMIARSMAARSTARLAKLQARYKDDCSGTGRLHVDYLVERDVAGIYTIQKLAKQDCCLQKQLDELACYVRGFGERIKQSLPACCCCPPDEYDRYVPRKVASGRATRWAGLSYQDLLSIADELSAMDKNSGFNSLRVVADETWNFTDGKRSVSEIARNIGFEFDLRIAPGAILRLLKGLEKAGKIEFVSR